MIIIKGLTLHKRFAAVALYPFILFSEKTVDPTLLNHEKIHLRQQLECLILLFYLWYAIEWCIHYRKERDSRKAYRMISFEKEAYEMETDFEYLKRRRVWAFLKWV